MRAVDALTPADVSAVRRLAASATAADGTAPLDEHVMLELATGAEQEALDVLVERSGGAAPRLVAYAHVDRVGGAAPAAQLVVDPAERGQGIGRHLVEHLLGHTAGRLRLWAHGERSDVPRMVAPLGLTAARTLLQLRRPLAGTGAALPPPRLPAGVRVRTFEPGRDDEAWVALNAAAFADHPEQGAWTLADLRQRMTEAWFDPGGFFLAERAGRPPEPERLVGSHWTKVLDGLGEVYVLAVDPADQGSGLGRALTLVGLRHLQAAGLGQVLLYVDADNAPAVRLYESLGFRRWDADVMYARS